MATKDDELVHLAWNSIMRFALDRDRKVAASAEVGLSWTRVLALRTLMTQPHTLHELAVQLSADPSYVTLMVDDLERRGFARRTPHPTDRRAKLVVITDDGLERVETANLILESPPAALYETPTADLEAVLRVHRQIDEAATERKSERLPSN